LFSWSSCASTRPAPRPIASASRSSFSATPRRLPASSEPRRNRSIVMPQHLRMMASLARPAPTVPSTLCRHQFPLPTFRIQVESQCGYKTRKNCHREQTIPPFLRHSRALSSQPKWRDLRLLPGRRLWPRQKSPVPYPHRPYSLVPTSLSPWTPRPQTLYPIP